jgi:hypothetical protein
MHARGARKLFPGLRTVSVTLAVFMPICAVQEACCVSGRKFVFDLTPWLEIDGGVGVDAKQAVSSARHDCAISY